MGILAKLKPSILAALIIITTRILFLFLLVTSHFSISGQQSRINLIVIDSITELPISFCHVSIDSVFGTCSNINGGVLLNFHDSVKLSFSHINYQEKSIQFKKVEPLGTSLVKLVPRTYHIEEIAINSEYLSASDIIEKAKEHLLENYQNTSSLNQAKFEHYSANYLDDSLLDPLQKIIGTFNILTQKPMQSNSRQNKLSEKIFIKNIVVPDIKNDRISKLILRQDWVKSLLTQNIYFYDSELKYSKKYTFKLNQVITLNSEKVYIINFTNNSNRILHSGSIYVQKSNYAILKIIESANENNRQGKDFLYSNYIVVEYTNIDGKMNLSSITFDVEVDNQWETNENFKSRYHNRIVIDEFNVNYNDRNINEEDYISGKKLKNKIPHGFKDYLFHQDLKISLKNKF